MPHPGDSRRTPARHHRTPPQLERIQSDHRPQRARTPNPRNSHHRTQDQPLVADWMSETVTGPVGRISGAACMAERFLRKSIAHEASTDPLPCASSAPRRRRTGCFCTVPDRYRSCARGHHRSQGQDRLPRGFVCIYPDIGFVGQPYVKRAGRRFGGAPAGLHPRQWQLDHQQQRPHGPGLRQGQLLRQPCLW
ncbi:hypothetical protein SCOCK_250002 [Actinacidiphila cocklensis]|uniref:Uncharacterized protein n=1 Tax=Actinacidiphila cocklensis TaxID=887465 RepID=A0A9W4DQ09_9ACTN|nr:hypothetical protein SCOCK_250002 [Actinacidiphila cocklensis]